MFKIVCSLLLITLVLSTIPMHAMRHDSYEHRREATRQQLIQAQQNVQSYRGIMALDKHICVVAGIVGTIGGCYALWAYRAGERACAIFGSGVAAFFGIGFLGSLKNYYSSKELLQLQLAREKSIKDTFKVGQ